MKRFIFLPIFSFIISNITMASECTKDYVGLKAGNTCKAGLTELHPTQFTVGIMEVQKKIEEIKGMSQSQIINFEKANPEPTVVGPGGALFITDHHHLARALLDSGEIDFTYCKIEANWSALNWGDFWKKMNNNHWFYLGYRGVMEPSDWVSKFLGLTVADLKDDPYRSLAGMVEDADGYDKKKAKTQFFEEFLWADYFRSKIPESLISSHPKEATEEGVRLAHDPAAKDLPGYEP